MNEINETDILDSDWMFHEKPHHLPNYDLVSELVMANSLFIMHVQITLIFSFSPTVNPSSLLPDDDPPKKKKTDSHFTILNMDLISVSPPHPCKAFLINL